MGNEVAIQKDISTEVLDRIRELQESRQLRLPPNYSVANALKSAQLIIQDLKDKNDKPALAVCAKTSIANALLGMVTSGLNPAKKQCYFIVHGSELTLMKSYFGTVKEAKRLGAKDVRGNVIYEKDEFDYYIDPMTGIKTVTTHKQTLANMTGKLAGAYAIVTMPDGSRQAEIMNMPQIQAAWGRGSAKGSSPAHRDHPEEMAKRTVINRACKLFINSSDDSALFIGDDDDDDYGDVIEAREAAVDEIRDNANSAPEIGFCGEPEQGELPSNTEASTPPLEEQAGF